MRLPAAVTATGKAMLSTLSNREIDELYQGKGSLSDLTSQSVKSLTSLHKQLAQIRKQGYAIDDGETREGMCSFGAPVFARGRNVAVAGVALSFFRADLDKAIRNQAIATLKELAATLSEKAVSLNPSRSS
jgi:DNA-binding IclR family transcriptional regulator